MPLSGYRITAELRFPLFTVFTIDSPWLGGMSGCLDTLDRDVLRIVVLGSRELPGTSIHWAHCVGLS